VLDLQFPIADLISHFGQILLVLLLHTPLLQLQLPRLAADLLLNLIGNQVRLLLDLLGQPFGAQRLHLLDMLLLQLSLLDAIELASGHALPQPLRLRVFDGHGVHGRRKALFRKRGVI